MEEKKRVQGGEKEMGESGNTRKRGERARKRSQRGMYKEEIKREDKYVFIIVGQKRSMHLHTYIGSIGTYHF